MTLDDVYRLLLLGLALTAWVRVCARPSPRTVAAAVAATLPLLEDA